MANIDLLHEITDSRERHYQIVQEIGSGGTARCYLAKCNGHFYVIKEFWPLNMRALLERKIPNGQLELPRNSSCMFPWYEQQLAYFRTEVDRCSNVNRDASSGENNFPYILHAMHVDGRDDLICVDTEDGFTLYDWVTVHADCWEADYVKSCIALMSRLLQLLQHIHKSWLHLDISPKNIYITAAGHCENFTVSREPNCTVKLFDFASAHEKKLFSEERVYELTSQPTTCTEGFTHPHLKTLGSVLAMAPEKAARYIREHPVDERVDLYSCGATLLYALSHTFPSGRDHITLPAKGILKAPTIREPLIEAIRILMGVTDICRPEDITHHALDTLQAIVAAIDNKAAFNSITARHQCSNKASQFPDEKETVPELMGQLCIDGTDSGTLVEYAMQQKKPVRLVIRAEQGGAGKTTQMQQLYRQLLSVRAVPFYVPLGDLRAGVTDPITQYICKEYFSTGDDTEKFRALLNDGTAPYWLLLDAVDEVPSGVSLNAEVQALLSVCPNLSVVITSRHQLTLQLQDIVTATLQPIGEGLVKQEFPHASTRMKEALRLPMMFRLARDVMNEHSPSAYEHGFLSWEELHIDSEGELMQAYIICQIQKSCKKGDEEEASEVLLSTLPEIAWSCATANRVTIAASARKHCVKAGILQHSAVTGRTRFTHERWLRFFKAYYVYKLLEASVDGDEACFCRARDILINTYLPEDLCMLVGDLARDYLRVPVQSEKTLFPTDSNVLSIMDQYMYIGLPVQSDGNLFPPASNEPSIIDRMVEKFCGQKDIGYVFSNLFRIMRYARMDDLSLLKIDGADLRKVNLNGVCFSHYMDNPQLCAQMKNCYIEEDNLMSSRLSSSRDFVLWKDYFIFLCQPWRNDSTIHIDRLEVYSTNGWYPIDHSTLSDILPEGFQSITLTKEEATEQYLKIAVLCEPDIVLHFQLDSDGKITFTSQHTTIREFSWQGTTYMIPAYRYFTLSTGEWHSYYIWYDKDANFVVIYEPRFDILRWGFLPDKVPYWDAYSQIYEHIHTFEEVDSADICVMKTNCSNYSIVFMHGEENAYSQKCYQLSPNLPLKEKSSHTSVTFLPTMHFGSFCNIGGLTYINGDLHYFLDFYAGSPINANSGIMTGLGIASHTVSHATYDNGMCWGDRDYRTCPKHSSILFSIENPQYVQTFPWRILTLSPDNRFMLCLIEKQSHDTLCLVEISSYRIISVILEETWLNHCAAWYNNTTCLFTGSGKFYILQIGSSSVSCSCVGYFGSTGSRVTFSTTDTTQVETHGAMEGLKNIYLENYTLYCALGYNSFENMCQNCKLEVSICYDSWSNSFIRDTSLELPKGTHDRWISYRDSLSLSQMSTLFKHNVHFLLIQGCIFKDLKTASENRQRFLEILRYNDALVDDE